MAFAKKFSVAPANITASVIIGGAILKSYSE